MGACSFQRPMPTSPGVASQLEGILLSSWLTTVPFAIGLADLISFTLLVTLHCIFLVSAAETLDLHKYIYVQYWFDHFDNTSAFLMGRMEKPRWQGHLRSDQSPGDSK